MSHIGIFSHNRALLGSGATVEEALIVASRNCGGVAPDSLLAQLHSTEGKLPTHDGLLFQAPMSQALEDDADVKAGKLVRLDRFEVKPDGTLDVKTRG